MRKYYTRPCNFYYGTQATNLINKKKAFPLAGNKKIAFEYINKLNAGGGTEARPALKFAMDIRRK